MEHNKISKFLYDSTTSKFTTRRRIDVNDLPGSQYSANKFIKSKHLMLMSDLCDYSSSCIVVKGTIDLLATGANENDKDHKDITFKNNAPFRLKMSKINNKLIGNVEDLDIVRSMYNLLEYSDNYSMTSGSMTSDEIGDAKQKDCHNPEIHETQTDHHNY